MDQRTADIMRSALFAECSDKELKSLVATGKTREFAAGDTIVSKDEGGLGFYIILDGLAEVRSGDNVLATMGPGGYFGEMALLLEDPQRTADVVAASDTTCMVITKWDFRATLSAHPAIGFRVMSNLAQRLQANQASLTE